MAEDGLGFRGLAQVLPRGGGNLSALANLAQRKQIADRDFAYKQQQDAFKADDELRKGLYTAKLNPVLQQAQQESFKRTYEGMTAARKKAMQTGDYSGMQQVDYDLKNNHDTFARGLESMQGELERIQKVVSDDKDKVFNSEAVGRKINTLTKGALVKEGNSVVGIDFDKAAELNRFFEDPDLYDDSAFNKKYVGKLGEIALETQSDSFGSTSKQTATNLFEVKNGKIRLDPNTGKPVPAATPEAIALYDSDQTGKKKLDKWAQSITPPGENWEKNRAKAFKKFVVEPFASYKEEKVISKPSESDRSGAKFQELADNRYKTLRNIVDNFDESALAQGFNVSDQIKAEFKGGGSKGNLPGENKPDQIVIYKRETTPGAEIGNPKSVQWTAIDIMPIGTEDQKDVAIFKMNQMQDEAQGKTGLVVGQDAIRKIHNNYKKSKPVDLGF